MNHKVTPAPAAPPPRRREETGLVVRSEVPSGLQYTEYRQWLRVDFFHACAYCTILETEARAIRFTIDHYESKEARQDLTNTYGNLMYCCDSCNQRKGDRCPPQSARDAGLRFFRPDEDLRDDHFRRSGTYVAHKSDVGRFTIDMLDLNRKPLRRLRDIRARLHECDDYVVDGIMALRSFPIDTLPPDVRHMAKKKVKEAMEAAADIGAAIDSLLREYAKSPLIDPDDEAADRAVLRSKILKEWQGLHPGSWRASRKGRKKRK